MSAKHWDLEVRRTGDDAQLRLAHPSGHCRQWNGDLACRLCERLGLDSGRYPCPKSSAWRLFLLARDLAAADGEGPEAAPGDGPAAAGIAPAIGPAVPEVDCDRLLKEQGLRPTGARRAIAARLFARPQHVTAESLAADLARTGSRYSLATVNRTLREFVDWDLLQVHDLGAGVVFYDTVTTPHPHIYNEDTGELLDLSREQAWIRGFPELPEGVRLQGVQLVFRVRQVQGPSGPSR
jgi:Fur family transcriptional regulator, iron response regulator